jgi:hypothetical protein
MTTGQSSRSSRTKEPSVTDHQEIEWQFDAGELESIEGWLDQHDSGSSGLVVAPESTVEITDTYYDTSVVPDSKPFRTLTKGKKWKTFEKVLERRSG